MRRKITPNNEIMLSSAVASLKYAFAEYKKAQEDMLRFTFIDNDGNLVVLEGQAEREENARKSFDEVIRIKKIVEELKARGKANE